jgi:osmotically-inducible protein OsmY
MSENNRRQHSRTQQRNWDDASNQRSFEHTNFDQNTGTQQGQSEQYPDYTTHQQYSQGYQNDYQQDPGYADWNNQSRYQDQNSRQRFQNRNYGQQYNQNQFGQQPGQFGPDDFNNPYWRENRQYGQPSGNQQYANNYHGQQQYSGQQFGGQPFSSYPGPQQHSSNSGRWNEDSRWNESVNRDNFQSGSNFGRSNFGTESNWEHNRQGSMRINEQGNLWSSGPHKGKGPKGYHRSDERIKEDISDRLLEDGLLDASNIEIECENNEVILSGSVDSRESKRRAEELCESIPGVTNVENRLHVSRENSWTERKEGASIGSDAKRRSSLATTTN